MKRYLLFCASDYYPSGGWDDFVGDYESIEKAKENLIDDFYHIVDSRTKKVIERGKVGGELWWLCPYCGNDDYVRVWNGVKCVKCKKVSKTSML